MDTKSKLQEGIELHRNGQLQQAELIYQQILQVNPENAEVLHLLGTIAHQVEKYDLSINLINQAIEIDPNQSSFFNNLGLTLQKRGRFEEAVQAYKQAIDLNSDSSESYYNLGITLNDQGKLEEAIQAYQQAIEINPKFPEAHHNLGTSLFLAGDFKNCWKHYEWRWKCPNTQLSLKERHLPQIRWEGSGLTDTSILVWAEQGVGDQITFASMFPSLLQAGAKVIVECEQRLIPLFKRSFPEIQFYPQENLPHTQLFDTNINYQVPMGNLGRWFRTDRDSFTRNKQSYLTACPKETKKRRRKYKELSNGRMLVGVSWKSAGPDQSWSESRSIPLNDYWISVLANKDCYFINLQYGDVKQELELLKSETGLTVYSDQDISTFENLDGFAAQVSALDLVISIDNTTAHIAGALGQEVWTLLPHIPYWRWLQDVEDTLWYKNMRLFRQDRIGDWSKVFQQVSISLQQNITGSRLS